MDTLEEKRRLFLDMQEHPDKYSDDELQAMLDDPQMEDDIECFGFLRGCMKHSAERMDDTEVSDGEIADEWRAFSREHVEAARPERSFRLLRVAAVFVGCLLMIGVAYAAVRFIKEREPMPIAEEGMTEAIATQDTVKNDSAKNAKTIEPTDSIVKFNDTELETLLTTMAEHYGVKTEFESESARHIHLFFIWNRNTSLADVLEVLNGYDRISVALKDNTLIVK